MAYEPYYGMAKNSREGNQSRKKRYYEALAERGIRPVQVLAPESAHPLIRQVAGLMTRDDDPLEPRAALRRAGGTNEPEPGEASPTSRGELEAARKRIAEIERQAEARRIIMAEAFERHRQVLEAERDAARAAEAVEREKARVTALEAQEASMLVRAAQGQATEATERAEKAEAAIRQAKTLPGIKGRLVRWLARDVLPD